MYRAQNPQLLPLQANGSLCSHCLCVALDSLHLLCSAESSIRHLVQSQPE